MMFISVLICMLLIDHQNSVYSYNRQHHKHRPPYEINTNGWECNDQGVCDRNTRSWRQKTQRQIGHYRRQPQTQSQNDCEDTDNCQTFESQRQLPNDCHNRLDCQPNDVSIGHNRRSHRHRHNEHENQIQRSPELVSMTALQTWRCDFSANDCGIHNQHNMNSYFTLMPDTMGPVFGKTGLLYIDLSDVRSAGARLITPYFPTNGCRYGCLSIEHILCGNTIESVYLIQQDVRNYCVWQKTNDHSYRWVTSSLTIDLSRSDPRFFIELRFSHRYRGSGKGFVAISDMAFKYGQCDHNDANECDLNQFVGTLL